MKWRIAFTVVGVTIYQVLIWTAVYFGMELVYRHFRLHPAPLVSVLVTAEIGHAITILTFLLVGLLQRPKQRAFLEGMVGALRQIGKGNFNVTLNFDEKHVRSSHPLGELVQSINSMAGELGQIEQMRQTFISNVSHEIQSPLTSIRGFANVLKNDALSAEERLHYLDIIETESTRLSKLSENLLQLTSLESEQHPFSPERYRLDRQIKEIALACEPQWVAKEIEMDVRLDEIYVVADKDSLSQVWVNLLSNAIKYTPVGGQVRIWASQNQSHTEVSISDTGIGISEDEHMHIFERFYKADKSRNRAVLGSGLGLAIVKSVVEKHSGSISVVSRLDAGASFTVRLPN